MFKMQSLSLLLLIICSYTDLKKRVISMRVLAVFLFLTAGLIVCAYVSDSRYLAIGESLIYDPSAENIIFSLIPGAVLFFISLFSKEAIGKGDVYLVGLLGLMTGFERIFVILFISMVACAAFGSICMLAKRKGKKDTLPYVPFLLGAYLTLMIMNNTGGV